MSALPQRFGDIINCMHYVYLIQLIKGHLLPNIKKYILLYEGGGGESKFKDCLLQMGLNGKQVKLY